MNATQDKPRILVIDDDTRILREQREYFELLGYDVTIAETEDAAKATFTKSQFDLVILDLMMENKDAGIVLAHHFKKAQPAVPILMTSDLTSETGMVVDLSGPGERRWIKVDRILPKPLRIERLGFEAELLLGAKSLGATQQNGYHDDDPQRLEI